MCLYGEDFLNKVLIYGDGVIGVVGWGRGIWGRGVSGQLRHLGHALSVVRAEGVSEKAAYKYLCSMG